MEDSIVLPATKVCHDVENDTKALYGEVGSGAKSKGIEQPGSVAITAAGSRLAIGKGDQSGIRR